MSTRTVKVAEIRSGKSPFREYLRVTYGPLPLAQALWSEIFFCWLGPLSGALGLALRSWFYPRLFASAGRRLLVGRNVTFRHPSKIRFGSGIILDDNCVVDAKGETNEGIWIEDDVFIGRGTIVYCKNGNIRLKKGVNLSSYCTVFSAHSLTVGEGTVIGGYSYLLSGGEYDFGEDARPFSQQDGMKSAGPLEIGANCWLGARVTVLDSACVGDNCVIGAGAVVTKSIPPWSVAVGVPARVVKSVRRSKA
ncbi:MAG: acyltransferase [Kiritimatiellia bacterium]